MDPIYLHCDAHHCGVQISEGVNVFYDGKAGKAYCSLNCASLDIEDTFDQKRRDVPSQEDIRRRLVEMPLAEAKKLRLEHRVEE